MSAPTMTAPAGCPWCRERLDPILVAAGFTAHPMCEEDRRAAHPGAGTVPDTTTPMFAQTGPPTGGPAGELRARVVDGVREFVANMPRTLQAELGPSEIGHPCARKLAYSLMGHPAVNTGGDLLPALVGTGGHHMMERVFGHERHQGRYRLELAVDCGAGIKGHTDCYDTVARTIIDWKFVGATSMRRYKTEGPSEQYRVQAHLYGLGCSNAGMQVDHVAIVFLPRGGLLSGIHVWCEPYDRAVAERAIARYRSIVELAVMLDVESRPEMYAHIPATPHQCDWCPFYKPNSTDLSVGCPGQ